MSNFSKFLLVLIIVWSIWEITQYFRRKNAAVRLSNAEFNKDIRRVQLIDIRDRDEYNAGHILGARNIPMMELKQRHHELRKDRPIYLYEDGAFIAYRAALQLRKYGFDDIYVLESGYKNWDGRIKRNKKSID